MANEKRLIDANEALRMMMNSQHDNPCTDRKLGGVWEVAHDCAISCVEACPTVDAVEVVHGRWKPDLHYRNGKPYRDEWYGHIFKCSVCGGTTMGDYDLVCRENYCPNCGAKMDGGNEDV